MCLLLAHRAHDNLLANIGVLLCTPFDHLGETLSFNTAEHCRFFNRLSFPSTGWELIY